MTIEASLSGKVVLVTGAARSLGRAFAGACVAAGALVVLSDADDLEALDPAASMALRLDVTDPAGWDHAVSATVGRFGRLDGLVNNAAIYFGRKFLLDEKPEDFARMLDVNVRGPWLGIRAAARAMRDTGGGSIVNLSSTSGLAGGKGFASYGTTRWAVRGLAKHAASELARYRIRVNSLHPHAVRGTGMFPSVDSGEAARDADFIPLGRLPSADEVADVLVFLLSDASAMMTGRELVIDGGASLGSG